MNKTVFNSDRKKNSLLLKRQKSQNLRQRIEKMTTSIRRGPVWIYKKVYELQKIERKNKRLYIFTFLPFLALQYWQTDKKNIYEIYAHI